MQQCQRLLGIGAALTASCPRPVFSRSQLRLASCWARSCSIGVAKIWRLCGIIPSVVRLPRLRSLRERKALTQNELAQKAGVDRSTISRLETDAESAFPTTVRKLAAALDVAPEDLQGARQPRTERNPGSGSRSVPKRLAAARHAREFLRKNPDLSTLVSQAVEHLERYFPDGRMHLRLLVDPEYGDEGLFLGVSTDLDDASALDALERFDQQWWTQNLHRSQASLVIDIAPE